MGAAHCEARSAASCAPRRAPHAVSACVRGPLATNGARATDHGCRAGVADRHLGDTPGHPHQPSSLLKGAWGGGGGAWTRGREGGPQAPKPPDGVTKRIRLCLTATSSNSGSPLPLSSLPPLPPPLSSPPSRGGGGRHLLVPAKNVSLSYCTELRNCETSSSDLMCTSFVLTHCPPQAPDNVPSKALLRAMSGPQKEPAPAVVQGPSPPRCPPVSQKVG